MEIEQVSQRCRGWFKIYVPIPMEWWTLEKWCYENIGLQEGYIEGGSKIFDPDGKWVSDISPDAWQGNTEPHTFYFQRKSDAEKFETLANKMEIERLLNDLLIERIRPHCIQFLNDAEYGLACGHAVIQIMEQSIQVDDLMASKIERLVELLGAEGNPVVEEFRLWRSRSDLNHPSGQGE